MALKDALRKRIIEIKEAFAEKDHELLLTQEKARNIQIELHELNGVYKELERQLNELENKKKEGGETK